MLEPYSVIDGKYKILQIIGRGGAGTVYLALNETANRKWAVKEIPKPESLRKEIRLLTHLSHKNLVQVADVVETEDSFLVVMEYIEGKDLKTVLSETMEKTGRPPNPDFVRSVGIQLCEVFTYLHTAAVPVIYCDLKPSNIILKPDGQIVLVDFGTARTENKEDPSGDACFGTPGYAAPEQYEDPKALTRAADLYALGATLTHLLTGVRPSGNLSGPVPVTAMRKTLKAETRASGQDVLCGLEKILLRCMARDPKKRFQSAEEIRKLLMAPEKLAAPFRKRLKRRLRLFCLSASSAAFFMVLSGTAAKAADTLRTNTYDDLVDEASTADAEEALALYSEAADLSPQRAEAYCGALDCMLDDFVLSDTEQSFLNRILHDRSPGMGSDHETCFRQSGGYPLFCLRLGLYSFYSAHDTYAAEGWFKKCKSSCDEYGTEESTEEGTEKQKKNAAEKESIRILSEALLHICDYRKKIEYQVFAGSRSELFREYWNSIRILFEGMTSESPAPEYEMLILADTAERICACLKDLLDAGISREEVIKITNQMEMLLNVKKEDPEVNQEIWLQSFNALEEVRRLTRIQ